MRAARATLKTVAKVAAVVAFTALSLLGLHRLLGNADRAVQAESVEPVARRIPLASVSSASKTHEGALSSQHNPSSNQSFASKTDAGANESDKYAPVTAQQNGHGGPQPEKPFSADDLDPEAVIGRPFPLSDSVETVCKRFSRGGKDFCAVEHEFLSRMANEPRDPFWASRVEKRLRALVKTEPDRVAVRSVECRSTLCAIEVVSVDGREDVIQYRSDLFDELIERGGGFADEKNDSGDEVIVSFYIYERRL